MVPRHFVYRLVELGDGLVAGLSGLGPLLPILEHDEIVGDRRWHRIGRDLGRADLREHPLDFGALPDPLLQRLLHRDRLGQARYWNEHPLSRHIAFVEVRTELVLDTYRHTVALRGSQTRTHKRRLKH